MYDMIIIWKVQTPMDIITIITRTCLLWHYFFRLKKYNLRQYNNTFNLHPVLYFYLLVLFLLQRITVWVFFCVLFYCVFNPTHHFNSKFGRGLEYVHMYLPFGHPSYQQLKNPVHVFMRNLHVMSNSYYYKHLVY